MPERWGSAAWASRLHALYTYIVHTHTHPRLAFCMGHDRCIASAWQQLQQRHRTGFIIIRGD